MTDKLPPELVAKLNAPLPKEAVSPHPTKPYLSTIKAIYVVERLNEVFGINGWQQRNEPMDSPGKMKQLHSFLDIPEYGIHLDNFGGNDNVDEGDAWKGAATDALTKMASYLGIGMDVFKGLADKGTVQSSKPATNSKASDKQKELIAKLMKQKNVTLESMASDEITPGTNPSEVIKYLLDFRSQEPVMVNE